IGVPCRKTVRADHAPASQCVHNKAEDRDVPSNRGKVGLVDPAVPKIVLSANAPALYPLALVPVRACPDGQPCCRQCRTKCLQRQNPASRSTRATRRNGSALLSTSEKLKANASFTQRVSVLGVETGEQLLPSLRPLSRAHLAMFKSQKALRFVNSRKSWTCVPKNF